MIDDDLEYSRCLHGIGRYFVIHRTSRVIIGEVGKEYGMWVARKLNGTKIAEARLRCMAAGRLERPDFGPKGVTA